MGQYFKPISIDKNESLSAHDFDNGLKLMEHSWIGNEFVNVVENLIMRGGKWFNTKIVWGGDYADGEAGDDSENLYAISNKINPKFGVKISGLRYILNLDTREFVDINKIPVSETYEGFDYIVHPLPLLTCEGNGRGGGDYNNKESSLIGKWSRNRVTIQKSKPKNAKELMFDLTE